MDGRQRRCTLHPLQPLLSLSLSRFLSLSPLFLLPFCSWCSVTWNLWTPFRLYAIVKINCHDSLPSSHLLHCKFCCPPFLQLSPLHLCSAFFLCMFFNAACYHSTTGHVSFVSNTRVTPLVFVHVVGAEAGAGAGEEMTSTRGRVMSPAHAKLKVWRAFNAVADAIATWSIMEQTLEQTGDKLTAV